MKPSAALMVTGYNFKTLSTLLISTFQTNHLHESLLMKYVVNNDDDDDHNHNNNNNLFNLGDIYMFSVISPYKNCISPRCTSATNSI
jgi:hypothetical protein